MNLATIKAAVPAWKKRKRLGIGNASGTGKTSGKGEKGQKSRSGYGRRFQKEGGQMPLFRRLPKRGFNNSVFRRVFQVVNLGDLEAFADGATVSPVEMEGAGLLRDAAAPVKVLGTGDLSKKLTVTADAFSKSAETKIRAAGGSTSKRG